MGATGSDGLPTGLGRAHGTSRHHPFDRWFRYPAGFHSETAAQLFDAVGVRAGGLIVDPFCGSGVVGTAAASRGHPFFGIEAHPLIAQLARLKLRRRLPGAPEELTASAGAFVTAAEMFADADTTAETRLVQDSFAPDVLANLVAMRTLLSSARDTAWEAWTPWLRWAVLGALRDVAAVRVGWPYQNPNRARRPQHADAGARVRARATVMAADLSTAESWPRPRPVAGVANADSRTAAAWRLPMPAAGCICSPPYLNNFDYADATRLELYFLGTVRSWAELVAGPRSKMMIASTQQTKKAAARRALLRLGALDGDLGRRMLALHHDIEIAVGARKRGKEYDRLFACYFADMLRVLHHLAAHLEPGAPAAFLVGDSAPYGVYVDTPTLLGELARTEGFTVVDDVVLRKRGLRWGNNPTRHDQPLTERLLLLRKPKPRRARIEPGPVRNLGSRLGTTSPRLRV